MSASGRARAAAFGRLIRVSLFPTAVADVLAGLLVGSGGSFPSVGATLALVAASLLVYHGGLALNDWADREHDARTRPDRPLPSGAIPARAVPLGVALGFVGAVLLAAWVTPVAGLWTAALAATATLYDLRGRGPFLGPSLLAVCRALNLGLGLFVGSLLLRGDAFIEPVTWSLPVLYGAYVFTVSRLGRLEDGEDSALGEGRPARFLRTAAVLLVLPPLVPIAGVGVLERVVAFAVLLAGAAGLYARSRSREPWTRARVGASMGLALRRLLLFGAATALLGSTSAAWITAAALLGIGYPLARGLARRFPPS